MAGMPAFLGHPWPGLLPGENAGAIFGGCLDASDAEKRRSIWPTPADMPAFLGHPWPPARRKCRSIFYRQGRRVCRPFLAIPGLQGTWAPARRKCRSNFRHVASNTVCPTTKMSSSGN